VLHIAVLGILMTGISVPRPPPVPVAAAPIIGTLVDTATLERQQQAREQSARQERQRQQQQERQRREAAEQQRVAQQREEQRVAAEQKARAEAEQRERDRVAAEKAAQERSEQQAREERARQAAAEKERQAREQAAREEAARRAAQQRREDELMAAAALEAEANAAREAGLYDQYVFAIQQRIRSKWQRPLSARPGIDCMVTVVQLPTGDVVSAKVATCNGDDAVRRSIERAVLDASPLPKAPTPAVFERIVNVRFQPEE
jgi:colicin import membrane protein